jgi:NADPH2 dehydrogenase
MLIFEPFQWGKLSLKNRLVMAPMCMYSASEEGEIQPFHLAHYPARAYGGVGLVIVEASAVESRGRISIHDVGIYSDAHLAGLHQLVSSVHQGGAKIAIQLAHAGKKSGDMKQEAISASALPFTPEHRIPKEMTQEDISTVIMAFQQAARRAQQAGFDGIEIHGAHGYLINQFLSPLTNHRLDEYGGSVENRTRFLKEILEAVHSVFRGEIWVRLSVEEYAEGGHHVDDTLQVVQGIRSLIAGVNVSSGGAVPVSIRSFPGYQLPFALALEKAGIPTMGGGLLTNDQDIENALKQGVSLIYLGRELLLNPYFYLQLVKKYRPEDVIAPYKRG